MLRDVLKEKTFSIHQKTEAAVIRKIKQVDSEADYVELLKCFYSYFSTVEKNIAPYLTEDILPDLKDRRDARYIKEDIETLGGSMDNLPPATSPQINDTLEALSAMYVLEGSLMGGPYIVKMLEKRGIERGFSFFNGYGENSEQMLGAFMDVVNKEGEKVNDHERAVEKAHETFANFGQVFETLQLS
ncbi:MAG TPA: biliverdin-producing heme oxygenase [Flavobacteriaceae bacterium]|nr:biliverdin-producing heme oxygenase [Flavobacteriaceae bacterium]